MQVQKKNVETKKTVIIFKRLRNSLRRKPMEKEIKRVQIEFHRVGGPKNEIKQNVWKIADKLNELIRTLNKHQKDLDKHLRKSKNSAEGTHEN